ncbi:tripartite tricarboxylate transporter substrate-binding protein [Roseateles saccharophilus]|uniref:tripartite tricarboxylate transporter substrate-binding protein n=1 Tax=Roseateles saccharophilus TaxID=304 RepID=UPI00104E9B01|nr:tripartite tricarboxylate transporter substrate-binding protein [Roseateles saccharophilus]MDG0835833.1 hypothetical protein [Roseateles saccharophilus]
MTLLLQATGLPFKTGAEAVIDTLPVAVPLQRRQRLRALAVTSAERLNELPLTPTVAEQGYAGFAGEETWRGLVVRRGVTPDRALGRPAAEGFAGFCAQFGCACGGVFAGRVHGLHPGRVQALASTAARGGADQSRLGGWQPARHGSEIR